MTIPSRFLNAIEKDPGNCVLVVGAGLSTTGVREGGNGLPDWDHLMKLMIHHLKESGRCDDEKIQQLGGMLTDSPPRYLDVAEEFSKAHCDDRTGYEIFLRSHLMPNDIVASDLHRLILKIGFWGIVSYNFDMVFERQSNTLVPIVYPECLTQIAQFQRRGFFAKIHGSINRPADGLVLTRTSYDKLRKQKNYATLVKTVLLSHRVLCVGFSLRDPDFQSILVDLKKQWEEHLPPLFALMRDPGNDVRQEWLKKGIDIIPYNNHEEIKGFFSELDMLSDNIHTTHHAPSEKSSIHEIVKSLGVLDVFEPPLERSRIWARVNKQAKLDTDGRMRKAFDGLNELRKGQKLLPYYEAPRYRLIKPPCFDSSHEKYTLDLGEADFIYVALLFTKEGVNSSTKSYVKKKIETAATQFPKELQNPDARINEMNIGQIGVQMVLVTSDGYTLLRKRGKSVIEFPGQWDVSFSGYCGNNALEEKEGEWNKLNIGSTVAFELEQEIGLSPDPRFIRFTGIHWANETGTTGILGYWKVPVNRERIAYCLNSKFPEGPTMFETEEERVNEAFVWDNQNLLVAFDGPAIASALRHLEESQPQEPVVIFPIARCSLLLALKALGKSTAGLETY